MLAHSLRDAGTAKKLAVLVTLETVSGEVVTQLKVTPRWFAIQLVAERR